MEERGSTWSTFLFIRKAKVFLLLANLCLCVIVQNCVICGLPDPTQAKKVIIFLSHKIKVDKEEEDWGTCWVNHSIDYPLPVLDRVPIWSQSWCSGNCITWLARTRLGAFLRVGRWKSSPTKPLNLRVRRKWFPKGQRMLGRQKHCVIFFIVSFLQLRILDGRNPSCHSPSVY